MEEHIVIDAGEVSLEGRLLAGRGPGGLVITHPHPLYGGNMDNNVVVTIGRAGAARGWTTLRFNFRGVGQSTGSYGEGLGEAADLAAALDFLQARVAGPYYLAGYSFGAYVAARALLQGLAADGAWLISPPIAFMDLGFLPETPGVKLIVAGDEDALCPLPALRALFPEGKGPEIKVIAGADHFWSGSEERLLQILQAQPL